MFIMESMGKKKPQPRRSFTAEFKAEIVELYDLLKSVF
jgi:transposase